MKISDYVSLETIIPHLAEEFEIQDELYGEQLDYFRCKVRAIEHNLCQVREHIEDLSNTVTHLLTELDTEIQFGSNGRR